MSYDLLTQRNFIDTHGKWVHIAIRFWFDDTNKVTTIRTYYNENFALDAGTGSPFVLLDEIFYSHVIGAELETTSGGISYMTNFFHGYLYNWCAAYESRVRFPDKLAMNERAGRVSTPTADHICERHPNTCGWDPDKTASANGSLPIISDPYFCPVN